MRLDPRDKLEYLDNVKQNHFMKLIRNKQNFINKASEQRRRDYLNERRLNENMRDKNLSAK